MNMRPMISVIVPIYKVEQYLEECAQSILRQSYEEFELILIDDAAAERSIMPTAIFNKRNVLDDKHFHTGMLNEDVDVTFKTVIRSKRVAETFKATPQSLCGVALKKHNYMKRDRHLLRSDAIYCDPRS